MDKQFHFPCELEREIMETTAYQDPQSVHKLPLVAKRVKGWIEPIIYHTITLNHTRSGAQFLRTLEQSQSKPVDFFSTKVKSLCLAKGVSVNEARMILDRCAGVETLACWVEPHIYAASTLMPIIGTRLRSLRKLSVNFPFQLLASGGTNVLRNVTHLDLSHPWALYSAKIDGATGAVDMTLFESLTKLSFRFWARDPETVGPVLHHILGTCAKLEALTLFVDNVAVMESARRLLGEVGLEQDKRVVLVPGRGSLVDEIWSDAVREL